MADPLESLPLWEALDCPARRAGVPGARCREWERCRAALRTHLRRVGCTREVCSPSALWLATSRRSPCPGACPAGTTWGDLCDGYTVGQVVAALAAVGSAVYFRKHPDKWVSAQLWAPRRYKAIQRSCATHV